MIKADLIEEARNISNVNGVPAWAAIEQAMEDYVQKWRTLTLEGQQLSEEQRRLEKLVNVPEFRPLILKYNEQLEAYNVSVAAFWRIPAMV